MIFTFDRLRGRRVPENENGPLDAELARASRVSPDQLLPQGLVAQALRALPAALRVEGRVSAAGE